MLDGRPGVAADGGRTVGAVLLAAGRSARFGEANKLLATVEDVPIVRRAARTLTESSVSGPVAVLGHEADAVRDALAGLPVESRHNEDYAAGQSTSVAAGVAVARERSWDAVLFALGDMPWVSPGTVETLVSAYASGSETVLAPAYEGTRGNPVVFDAGHFEALAAVSGDRGGRDLIERSGTLVPVDDPGVCRDVDRPGDLESR